LHHGVFDVTPNSFGSHPPNISSEVVTSGSDPHVTGQDVTTRSADFERQERLRGFAEVGSRVLSETKDDFAADLKDLYPVIKALNDNADDFIKDLEFLPTFPFHYKYLRNAVRGDYLNVFVTFDLTVRRFGESMFTTSFFDPNMKHLDEVINPPDFLTGRMANLSGQAADPFKIPPGTATQHEGTP